MPIHQLLWAVFRRPSETFSAFRVDPPLKPAVALLLATGAVAGTVYWFVPLIGTLRMADMQVLLSLYPVVMGTLLLLAAPAVLTYVARALGGRGEAAAGIAATSLLVAALFLFQTSLGLVARHMLAVGVLTLPFLAWLLWLSYLQLRTLHELPPAKALGALVLSGAALGAAWTGFSYTLVIPIQRRQTELQSIIAGSKLAWPAPVQPGAGRANAAAHYKQAEAALQKLTEPEKAAIDAIAAGGWPRRGSPQIEAALARNEAALALFRKAVHVPYCDFTFGRLQTVTLETPTYQFGATLDLARLLVAGARRLEARGRHDAAMEDLSAALLYARHAAAQRNAAMIGSLVQTIVVAKVWPQASASIASGTASPAAYKRLWQVLEQVQNGKTPAGEIMRIETAFTVAHAAQSARALDIGYRPHVGARAALESRQTVEAGVARLALAADKNQPALYEGFFEEARRETPKMFNAQSAPDLFHCFTHPDTIGRCLGLVHLYLSAHYGKVIGTFHFAGARLEVLKAAAGIRLGLQPAELDPFNEFKPLSLRRLSDGSWLVYSAGPDRDDDKGEVTYPHEFNDEPQLSKPSSGDIVIRVAAQAPAAPARKPTKKKRRR